MDVRDNACRLRRAILTFSMLAWISATVSIWVWLMPFIALPLPLVAMAPGLGLFMYAINRPDVRTTAIRMTSASVGMFVYFRTSQGLRRCGPDGLCGMNVFNGALADMATFVALSAAAAVQNQLRTRALRELRPFSETPEHREPEQPPRDNGRHLR